MNERAQQLITDASEKVLAYLEATEGFAVEQAPILAQEFLTWGLWKYGLGAVLWVLLSVSILGVGLYLRKVLAEDKLDRDCALCMTICISATPVLGVVISAANVLKIFVTPRLYIIEQIAALL